MCLIIAVWRVQVIILRGFLLLPLSHLPTLGTDVCTFGGFVVRTSSQLAQAHVEIFLTC